MHEWYYSQGGQQLGPISWDQLVALAASGQLGASDLVWKHPMPAWVAAASVAGLMGGPAYGGPAFGGSAYGGSSSAGGMATPYGTPPAPSYAAAYDPGNPYAAPQAVSSGSGSSWITQWTVVSILLMVEGGLECAMSLLFPLVGLAPQDNADAPPAAFFFGYGAVVFLIGLVKIMGGFFGFRFRLRPLGFAALGSCLLSVCTCYCIPTSLAVGIYGLIVMLNEHVAAAFALGSQGLSRQEIVGRFR
jgi:hypothetical protein